MKTFITGASGLVGSKVLQALAKMGPVVGLSRCTNGLPTLSSVEWIQGAPQVDGPWSTRLSGADAVVHLAGEPIFAGRWNRDLRERVVSSRVEGTRHLVDLIGAIADGERPRVLVSASSYGYYGYRDGAQQDESAPPGDSFLSELSCRWESEAARAAQFGVRVVLLRFGLVLQRDEGALANMVPAFRAFVGGPVGDGTQYLPWVHHADAAGLVLHALRADQVHGPLNVVAPEAMQMKVFARKLGAILRRPSWLGMPAFVVHLKHGDVADALLRGANIQPRVALETGYEFRFPKLEVALDDLLAARDS